MAWIEDALKVSGLNIDDLFVFDTNGFVTSRCADFDEQETEQQSTEEMIFINPRGCEHEGGDESDYEEWKEDMMRLFERKWPGKLQEEAFFRSEDKIPGGSDLLERTKTRKNKRAEKFRPQHHRQYSMDDV